MRSRSLDAAAGHAHDAEGAGAAQAHLGAYAPLVAAIRDELEHFAASQLRLHLAIAERDRYVLTSIEVACDESERAREPAAPVHRRVHARADQALPRARHHRRPAQRERDRPVAVRRAERRASAPTSRARTIRTRALIAELKGNVPDAGTRAFDVTLVGPLGARAMRRCARTPPHPRRPARTRRSPRARSRSRSTMRAASQPRRPRAR